MFAEFSTIAHVVGLGMCGIGFGWLVGCAIHFFRAIPNEPCKWWHQEEE